MTKGRLLANSASSTLLYIVNVALALAMTPIYVSHLGAAGYGIWELMLALVGYLSVLDLGIAPALVQFFALARGKNSSDEVQRVFSTGFSALTCVGTIGALILVAVAIRPDAILNVSATAVEETRIALVIFAANFWMSWVRAPFTCYLMGMQRHYLINGIRIICTSAEALAIWYLLQSTSLSGLAILAGVGLTGTTLQLAIFSTYSKLNNPTLRLRLRPERALLMTMSRFGLKSAVLIGSYSAVRTGLLMVIANVAGVGAVIFFVLPFKLIEYSISLTSAMGLPLEPYFATLVGESNRDLGLAWKLSTRALQFVGYAMSISCLFLGLPFLKIWMGATYALESATSLYILISALFIQSACAASSRVLIGTNKHGQLAGITAITALAILAASIPAVYYYGTEGSALSCVLFLLIFHITSFLQACRALCLSPLKMTYEVVVPFLLPIMLSSLVFFLATFMLEPASYLTLFADGAVGIGVYLFVCWYTVLNRTERSAVLVRLGIPRNRGNGP